MKRASLSLAGLLLASLTANAQLTVEDFEDSFKDPTLWGADEGTTGVLAESDGRLNFTNPAPSGEIEVSCPLLIPLPADDGWQVTAEVFNSVNTVIAPQITSIGVAVFPSGEREREVFLEIYSSWTDFGGVWGYYTELFDPTASFPGSNDSGNDIPINSGQIRLSYDPGTGIFTAEYWPTGEPGWIELATFGVGGSGGTHGTGDWGLGPGDTFDLTLFGYANERVVSYGQMFIESLTLEGVDFNPGPPLVANDDRITVRKDIMDYVIEVKVNDRSLLGAPETVTVTEVSESLIGAMVSTDGEGVRYTPPAGFIGSDTLTYTVEDGAGNTDSADILIEVVDLAYPGSASDAALIAELEKLGRSLSVWERFYLLYEKHIAEILLLTVDGGDAGLARGSPGPPENGSGTVRQGTGETQLLLEEFFTTLTDPAVAILTGQSDTVQITDEMVDVVMEMREYLQETGSDALKADLEMLTEEAEASEAYVGRSLEGQLLVPELAGLLDSFDPQLSAGALFSIRSWNITGVVPGLWRYALDNLEGWTPIETHRTQEETSVLLSDPDPIDGPVLYQVRGELIP